MPVDMDRIRVLKHAEGIFATKNVRRIFYNSIRKEAALYLRVGVIEIDSFDVPDNKAYIISLDDGVYTYAETDLNDSSQTYSLSDSSLHSIKLRLA
jgi:hypothetical protein